MVIIIWFWHNQGPSVNMMEDGKMLSPICCDFYLEDSGLVIFLKVYVVEFSPAFWIEGMDTNSWKEASSWFNREQRFSRQEKDCLFFGEIVLESVFLEILWWVTWTWMQCVVTGEDDRKCCYQELGERCHCRVDMEWCLSWISTTVLNIYGVMDDVLLDETIIYYLTQTHVINNKWSTM